jgi:hypothetical protein
MQELDLCIADCKLGFVWLDEPQEMQLACSIADNNRPSISGRSAAIHCTVWGENGYLPSALQIPEPQRSVN